MTSSVISAVDLGGMLSSMQYLPDWLQPSAKVAVKETVMPIQQETVKTGLAAALNGIDLPMRKFASANVDITSFSPNGVSVGKSNETQR